MALRYILPPPATHKRAPWPRSRRRAWTRRDTQASVSLVLATIPSLPRAALARLTDRMIDRMDEIDGDPDMEETREDWEDSHDREYVQDV